MKSDKKLRYICEDCNKIYWTRIPESTLCIRCRFPNTKPRFRRSKTNPKYFTDIPKIKEY